MLSHEDNMQWVCIMCWRENDVQYIYIFCLDKCYFLKRNEMLVFHTKHLYMLNEVKRFSLIETKFY